MKEKFLLLLLVINKLGACAASKLIVTEEFSIKTAQIHLNEIKEQAEKISV